MKDKEKYSRRELLRKISFRLVGVIGLSRSSDKREKAPLVGEIDFQHNGETLTAKHQFYGFENSKTLLALIHTNGLREPTSAELTSFAHKYFERKDPISEEFTGIMKGGGSFRGFTGIVEVSNRSISTPDSFKKGFAYFVNYPEFYVGTGLIEDSLIRRLNESYAEIPLDNFREEHVEWRKVAKHSYFIAWAGSEEGAEKLAELASKHPKKEAYLWSPTFNGRPHLCPVASVASLRYSEEGLGVLFEGCKGYGGHYAFGIVTPKKIDNKNP